MIVQEKGAELLLGSLPSSGGLSSSTGLHLRDEHGFPRGKERLHQSSLGDSWKHLGYISEPLGGILEALGGVWGSLGGVLGSL